MATTSLVIVGGGVMGLSAAWHLRRRRPRMDVVVIERAQIGAAASGASAAGVRVMGRDPAERALALASLGRRPDLGRELEAFTRDDVPVLGPVPGVDGLLVAAGFSGHGFALAPAVGDLLARLACGDDAHTGLWRGLRLDRFAATAAAER